MNEWEDEIYVCDNCGYSGAGAFIVFNPTGDMKPVCLCRECADDMIRYNE